LKFRTLQTQISPGRRAQQPCPAAGSADIPSLSEGSRRRFRLLSVHSHSHGGQSFGAVKRKQRGKESRALAAQAVSFAVECYRVCRLHGAVFLPCSGICLPESMF